MYICREAIHQDMYVAATSFAYKELTVERMSLSVSDQPTSPHCWGIDSRDYLVPNTS